MNTLSRRDFGRQIAFGVAGTLLASRLARAAELAATGGAAAQPRPNILFMISDQHAWKYCGFAGHPVVETPNLDRIAKLGTVFRSTYCGNPVCAPSRAGMLSGVYPSDCNSFCNTTVWDGSLPAWPRLLRDAGYLTFGTGKMDTDPKFDLGFVKSVALGHGHVKSPDVTGFFRRPPCSRVDERRLVDGEPRTRRHPDESKFTQTVDFIRSQRKGGQPWMAYCGTNIPHPPFRGLTDRFEHYLPRVDLPVVAQEELEDLHWVYRQLRHFKDIATPIPEEKKRRARAGYYAMISELDEYIGRLWSALEETGQLENTIFVYTSDHGESLGEHGLWLKNNLYDVAARVPLVVAGAGIPRGQVVDTPVAHVDLIRTLLEVGQARTHSKLRGHSLLPLAHGEKGDHPGWAYSESHSEGNPTGSFMIRKGDWKYIHFVWHEGLLFNLAEDPAERHNRIADPAVQPLLKELQDILHAQVDPIEVTQRAFAVQKKRLDRFVQGLTGNEVLDSHRFRDRLGEGQAVGLLTAYYGHPFPYDHKAASKDFAD